jgi:hypothetical protein
VKSKAAKQSRWPKPLARDCFAARYDVSAADLARRMRAGRRLIPSGRPLCRTRRAPHFRPRMRAGGGLPCPRHPLGRARLAIAPGTLVVAPTIRACRRRRRAAADAPQLLGIQLVRDVAGTRPVGRVVAVRVAVRAVGRVAISRTVGYAVVHRHPLVRRGCCDRRCWRGGCSGWRGGGSRGGR